MKRVQNGAEFVCLPWMKSSQLGELLESSSEIREAFISLNTFHQILNILSYTTSNDVRFFGLESKLQGASVGIGQRPRLSSIWVGHSQRSEAKICRKQIHLKLALFNFIPSTCFFMSSYVVGFLHCVPKFNQQQWR